MKMKNPSKEHERLVGELEETATASGYIENINGDSLGFPDILRLNHPKQQMVAGIAVDASIEKIISKETRERLTTTLTGLKGSFSQHGKDSVCLILATNDLAYAKHLASSLPDLFTSEGIPTNEIPKFGVKTKNGNTFIVHQA
jgi:hypothetical protein